MATAKKNAGTETTEETSTKPDPNQKIKDAFEAAVNAEKNEDQIKMDMIKAGCPFKSVAKMYNDLQVEAGLVSSKEERNAILDKALKEKDLTSEKVFDKAVGTIVEKVKGANEKSAAALIRAWAKKNEVECFVKPKAESGGGRSGFASGFYAWLAKNPKSTAAQAKAFIQGTDGHEATSENVKRHESHYLGVHALVNKVANS